MRKITQKIAATIGVLLLTATTALAQNAGMSAQDAAKLLPADIDALYKFNTSEENLIEDWFVENIMSEFIVQEILDRKLAQTILKDTVISIATKIPSETTEDYSYESSYVEPDTYILIKATAEQFEELPVKAIYSEHTEVYKNINIYNAYEKDGGAAYVGNFIVVCSNVDNLKKVIDLYTNNGESSLAEDENYQKTSAHFVAKNFFNVYINTGSFMEEFNQDFFLESFGLFGFDGNNSLFSDTYKALNEAFLAEGISINQHKEGLGFKISVEADNEVLHDLDMDLDKYTFIPSLYKNVSGENLMLYSEAKNLTGRVEDMMKLLNNKNELVKAYDDWKVEFKTSPGIDLDKNFLDLMTGNNAIFLHKTDQVYPALTFVFDTEGKDLEANAALQKIANYLMEEFEKMAVEYPGFFDYDTYKVGSTRYHEFQLDTGKIICHEYCNEEDKKLFSTTDVATIYLRMGVTSNGKVVISTHPDLEKTFQSSTDLMDNENFANAFTNPQEKIDSIFYMDLDELENYIGNVMDLGNAPSYNQEEMHSTLAPWNSLFLKKYTNQDSAWAVGMLRADSKAFDQILEYGFLGNFSEYDYDYEYNNYEDYDYGEDVEVNDYSTFCDVKKDDWYFDAVDELNYQGIMKGYEDGCFRPNNITTRSEFIRILSQARTATRPAGGEDEVYSVPGPYFEGEYVEHANPFTDVRESDWYYEDVMHLYNEGALKGFNDGTLRPGTSISRAEAVQLMYNLSSKLQSPHTADEPMPFTDVTSKAWYYKAVFAAWQHHIVNGTTATTFEPAKNLTRAEAAVIIDRFINHETSCDCECPCHTDELTNDNVHEDYTTTSFKPVYFMLPQGVSNKTESITDYEMSINYETEKSSEDACEAQAALLTKDGWKTYYDEAFNDDYSWTQSFIYNDDTWLSLSCSNYEGKTYVNLYEYQY